MQPASNASRPTPEPAPAAVVAAAPDWFRSALEQVPARTRVPVEGVDIEVLTWGEPGHPGLLLLHGFSAHADWWSFVAPLLARGRRVVALSFSGMGRSGWRDTYSLEQYAREALAVAKREHLFDASRPPILVGHSFGSFVARRAARTDADRLGGIVLVDGALAVDDDDDEYDGVPRLGHRHRVYAQLEQAIARFRFSPPQHCEHPWIQDFLARTSLRPAADETGAQGWSWCFDPDLRAKIQALPNAALLEPPACPLSLMFGDRSLLMTPPRRALLRRVTPPTAPWIEIPDAGHHVMVDQPLALVSALRAQLETWQPAAGFDFRS
jgi:pimeloyl-ACP methyl ester carboxylesterase